VILFTNSEYRAHQENVNERMHSSGNIHNIKHLDLRTFLKGFIILFVEPELLEGKSMTDSNT
jgi:hypothetical protein